MNETNKTSSLDHTKMMNEDSMSLTFDQSQDQSTFMNNHTKLIEKDDTEIQVVEMMDDSDLNRN